MLRMIPQAIACALVLFASTAQATTAVGRIEGAFAVSDAGQATYTIPIKVSPGIAGMEPKLALAYSSDAGNGLLGMGWSLSGLSAITRCPSTWAQDNGVRGVFFDALDKFCLDGQKLRLASGSYGTDLSDYRTEIDGFMRIVAHGGGAAGAVPTVGPQWFSAKTRDGVVIRVRRNRRLENRGAGQDRRPRVGGQQDHGRAWQLHRV